LQNVLERAEQEVKCVAVELQELAIGDGRQRRRARLALEQRALAEIIANVVAL
jgi:hypothetical protein